MTAQRAVCAGLRQHCFPHDVTRRCQAVRCRPGLKPPGLETETGRRDVQEGGSDREGLGEAGSDAESDGYGEAGLTWEAVMQSMQVRATACELQPVLRYVLSNFRRGCCGAEASQVHQTAGLRTQLRARRVQEPAAEGEEEAAAPAPAAAAEDPEPGAASRRKARKRPRS